MQSYWVQMTATHTVLELRERPVPEPNSHQRWPFGLCIAADIGAKSPVDRYTLLFASPSSTSVNPALNPKLPYKPADLAPVPKMTTSPLVLAVNPSTGIRTVSELIAAAKKEPGTLNYSSSGKRFGASKPSRGNTPEAVDSNLSPISEKVDCCDHRERDHQHRD